MILSDQTILKELGTNIIISPFNIQHLNPCSVDLTLAPEFKVYTKRYESWGVLKALDPRVPNQTVTFEIPEDGYVIEPGDVYLYACNERIGVKGNIRGKVEGKSSLGRLGLFVHATAGFIDAGFEGSLVLELVPTRPIKLYPNMKICQIEFARVEGEILEPYDKKAGSKYHNQTGVQESKYHENF
jgi:dCTP deaminase